MYGSSIHVPFVVAHSLDRYIIYVRLKARVTGQTSLFDLLLFLITDTDSVKTCPLRIKELDCACRADEPLLCGEDEGGYGVDDGGCHSFLPSFHHPFLP